MSELVFKVSRAKSEILSAARARVRLVTEEHNNSARELMYLLDEIMDGAQTGDDLNVLLERFTRARSRVEALRELREEMQKIVAEAESAR